MNCRSVQPVLTLYASGDLDFSDAVRVREHVRKCPDCALALEREREIIDALNRAGRDREAPPGVFDEITAGVMERLDEKPAVPLAVYRRVPAWGRTKAVAALAALVIVAVLLVMAVMPEQPVAVPAVAEPTEIPAEKLDSMLTMFELGPGEERLKRVRPESGNVRVPNWRYRRNWLEKMETPDAVRVVPTSDSSF